MTAPAPTSLTVDDHAAPHSVGTHARFAWSSAEPFTARQVQIFDATGAKVWDSGHTAGTMPALVVPTIDLKSHNTYRWAVRTWTTSDEAGPWSEQATFETALLHDDDRTGEWIARPVPLANRILRSIDHDRTDTVTVGGVLGQTFTVEGAFTALTVDLIATRGEITEADLELTRVSDGSLVSRRHLAPVQFPGDRFAHWMSLPTPAPAGEYLLELRPTTGSVGWRTTSSPGPIESLDLDVYPAALRGLASADGTPVNGQRALGVETVPAPNPIFHRTFSVGTDIARARLTVSALGYAQVTVNGLPITDDVLEPAPTSITHRTLSRTYDVTALLVEGDNVIEIECGRGYVGTRGASTWSWNLAPHHQEPAAFAELHLVDSSGASAVIATDADWQTRASSVTFDSLYGGETHDFSAEPTDWERAATIPAPRGDLHAATHPSVRRHSPIKPARSTAISATATVHGFGAVTAGWIRLTAAGGPGDRVTVEYAEQVDDHGDIAFENVLAAGRAQIDEFILGPEGGSQALEAKFTYRGFRFVRISAPPSAVIDAVEAVPVHTDAVSAGRFSTSHSLLNWIDDATARSVLNNLHGIPTDTPAYEKNGWTADAHLVAEAALHHFDLRSFFEKWLRDHADSQLDDGTIPQIVPTPGWGLAPDPAWAASFPLIVWNLYWEYGDPHILEEHADGLVRYIQRLTTLVSETGWLWQEHSWGDWLAPGHHFAPEGATPTASLMLLKSVQVVRQVLETLGRADQTAWLRDAETRIAGAYNAAYLDHSTRSYRSSEAGYRQVMNILPLAFGIVPAEFTRDVEQSLVFDLEHRTNRHLDVGSVGTEYILPVLTAAGSSDLALEVATQLDRPGWGLWQQAGSSTLWESWDANVRSHDHYFLGSIGKWLHESVAGVSPTSAGWQSCDFTPNVVGDIQSATFSHQTPSGTVRLEWEKSSAGLSLVTEVPAGVAAVLDLKHLGGGTITVDGAPLPSAARQNVPEGHHQLTWSPSTQRPGAEASSARA